MLGTVPRVPDDKSTVTVVGLGWLGRAVAAQAPGVRHVGGRAFRAADIVPNGVVIAASGRSTAPSTGSGVAIAAELAHLRSILSAAADADAARVVLLGSSDVAGTASEVCGASAAAPTTVYGQMKAAAEDEAVAWRDRGLDVVVTRLAPVHGAGKARTESLVRAAGRRVVPLPGGGSHSVGFVLLADAVDAIWRLAELRGGAPVVSVGAGHVPLGALMSALGRAQQRGGVLVPLPVPAKVVRMAIEAGVPESVHRWLRFALPRTVVMETDIVPTPLDEAARRLVHDVAC